MEASSTNMEVAILEEIDDVIGMCQGMLVGSKVAKSLNERSLSGLLQARDSLSGNQAEIGLELFLGKDHTRALRTQIEAAVKIAMNNPELFDTHIGMFEFPVLNKRHEIGQQLLGLLANNQARMNNAMEAVYNLIKDLDDRLGDYSETEFSFDALLRLEGRLLELGYKQFNHRTGSIFCSAAMGRMRKHMLANGFLQEGSGRIVLKMLGNRFPEEVGGSIYLDDGDRERLKQASSGLSTRFSANNKLYVSGIDEVRELYDQVLELHV